MDEIMGLPDMKDAAALLDGVGDAGIGLAKLTERIDAVTGGWFAVHKAKQDARAAKAKMELSAEALRSVGLEPSEADLRAIAFCALGEIKGFENLEAVVSRIEIPADADPSGIDDEWMAQWVEGSKEAFSEWRRAVMADAAAAKSAEPSSVSVAALDCISRMEGAGTKALRTTMALCPSGEDDGMGPMILLESDEALSKVGLTRSDIFRLRDRGILVERPNRKRKSPPEKDWAMNQDSDHRHLASTREDRSFLFSFPSGSVIAPAAGYDVRLTVGIASDWFADYGSFDLTEAGKEVAQLLSPSRLDASLIGEYLSISYERISNIERKKAEAAQFSKRELERTMKDILRRPSF